MPKPSTHHAPLKKGDSVHWKTPQGTTEGTVVKKVTSTARVAGHVAHATPAELQYDVESDRTGKHALHRPDALSRS